MQTTNASSKTNQNQEGHCAQGNVQHGERQISNEHAAKRIEKKGMWGAERMGKVRIVEFHKQPNGDSYSVTHWFNTWIEALEFFGMATQYASHCSCCGEHNPENRYINPCGQWACMNCAEGWSETAWDLFIFSQGRWSL